ncbi:MAG: hypothetical protein ACRENQ_06340 [Gemmatimonadaceae bacterium]
MKFFFGMHPEATRVWRSSLFSVRMLSLIMASVAFSIVLWVTAPPGPGVDPSSASYLGAAQSLVDGHGYRVPTARWDAPDSTAPLTHYPPGFSTAIALPVAMGFPPLQGARLVEALSAFVTMAVLVALVGDAVGMGAAAAFAVALLLMPLMVDLHLMVLSEPLFLALMALTLATMVAAPETPIAAGVCATAALAVRYTGIGVVAGTVVWAMMGRGSLKARLQRGALAILPTFLLGVAWFWVAGASGGSAIRRLGLYGGLDGALSDGGATIAQWLVPTSGATAWVWWAALPAVIVVGAVFTAGVRRARRLWRLLPRNLPIQSSTNVPQMVAARVLGAGAVLGSSYAAALIAARLFADGSFTFDARLMSPLLMIASLAFAVSAATWWRSAGRWPRTGLAVLLLAWGAASLVATRSRVHESLTYGLDFSSDAWRGSPVLEWVRADGGRRPMYSNWPSLPYLYLDRPARGVPASGDAATLRAFGAGVAAGDGVVLVFRVDNPAFVTGDSLVAGSGLRVLASFPGGRVLGRAAEPAR